MENDKNSIPQIFHAEGVPPVVMVKGTNYEMGYQYAEQLAPQIWTVLAKLKTSLFPMYREEVVVNDMKVQQYFADKYTPGFREWQKGMCDGCAAMGYEVSMEDIMLIAVFTSEMYERPTGEYPAEAGVGSADQTLKNEKEHERNFCTTFGVTGKCTKSGNSIIAGIGGSAFESIDRVILIAFPTEGYSFITCATIGKFHDQVGMNTSGMAWVFSGNYSGPSDWAMMPEPPFYHITQYCANADEVGNFIENMPRCGAFANFVIGTAQGDVTAIESNAEHFFMREPGHLNEPAEYVVNTNHFASPETQAFNVDLDGIDWKEWNYASITRFATASQYLSDYAVKGEMDMEKVREMFASDDWFDPDAKRWHHNDPGSDPYGSNNGFDGYDYTLQAAFEPATMTAYFMQGTGSGTGMPAGSTGQFVEIQLMDDSLEMAAVMQERTFSLFADARKELRKIINGSKEIQKNYLVRTAYEQLLDEAYLAYESGQDRRAHAFMLCHEGNADEADSLKLLGEAMSYFAKAQTTCKILINETKKYKVSC